MRTDDITEKIADPIWDGLAAEGVNFVGFWFGLMTNFRVHKCEFRMLSLDYDAGIVLTKCKICGHEHYR